MKSLLRKFHIGGSSDGARASSSSSPSSSQSCATDHRRLDGSWTHATGGAAELPNSRPRATQATGRVSDNTNNGEGEQEMDYSLMEEEFQVQLALALSASNTDDVTGRGGGGGGGHVDFRQIGAARATQDSADVISRRYWDYNVLDYDERILDGFYDVSGNSSDPSFKEMLPSLTELEQTPMPGNLDYEVVLVNRAIDPALEEIEQIALCSLDSGPTESGPVNRSLAKRIAVIIADHMGGPVSNANEMLARWTITSYELRASSNNIILLLGCLKIGLSRHRALLFKVLADLVGLPCRLVKGSHYTGIDGGAVNIVKLDEGEFIVDLMGAPGTLIPVEAPSTPSAQNAEMDSFIIDHRISPRAFQDLLPLQDKNNFHPAEIATPQMNPNSEQKFQDVLFGGSAVAAASPFFSEINPYQHVGEKKVMEWNKFSEIKNTEFYRCRENIFSGPGRPPLPVMRKNPFICNNVLGENPCSDLLDGLSVGRKPEVRGYNISTIPESSASQVPHVVNSGVAYLTNNHISAIQSPSDALVHSRMHKGLLDTSVAVTTATDIVVGSSVVAPESRYSEPAVDVPMVFAAKTFLPSCNENEKQTEVTNLFAQDVRDRKDNYAKRKVKETSEYERKIYDKHGCPQYTNDRLANTKGNSEDEQTPSHSNSFHRPRLDTVLDDVAEWEIPWEDLVIGERIGLDSFRVDEEAINGLNTCIERLVVDEAARDIIVDEQQIYKNAEGRFFSSPLCIRRRTTHQPDLWWEDYSARTPNLQKLVIRILLQPCSASGCERNWSIFEAIHTKKRNTLTTQASMALCLCGTIFVFV